MPEFTCPTCGQLVQGDECPRCRAASAIAKLEHAEQAKVTPLAASDGAFGEGDPPVEPAPLPPIRKRNRHLFWAIWIVLAMIAMYWFLVLVCNQGQY